MRPSSDTAVLLTTFTAGASVPGGRRVAAAARDLHAGPLEALHRRPLLDADGHVIDKHVLEDDLGEGLGDALDEQELLPLHRVDQVGGEAVVDGPLEVVGERGVAQRRAIELDLDAQRLGRRSLRVGAADPARHFQAFEEEHVHQTRSSTHFGTDASASPRREGSLPPAIAMSALPPPLPPTCAATKLARSPALTRPVLSAVTPAAICTFWPSTAARTITAVFSLSLSLSSVSRSVFASAPSSRAASTFSPLTSTARCARSSPCAEARRPLSAASSFSSARTCSSTWPTRAGTSSGALRSSPARRPSVASSDCR